MCLFRILIVTLAWPWVMMPALTSPVQAEIRAADLQSNRFIMEEDWLRLKLRLLGLRLSFPAYRIDLELDPNNTISFTFLSSGGMAEHMSGAGRAEAELLLGYHATGIRDRVEKMIQNDFQVLWPRFDSSTDVGGRFLVPGETWEDAPRELAQWQADRFHWAP